MGGVALREIVAQLGGELIGDGSLPITAIRPLTSAGSADIAFLANPRYRAQIESTQAACVIVAPALRETASARGAAIVTDDPYVYFARLTRWWEARIRPAARPGIHPTASLDPQATVAPTASVAAFAVIEAGASIGDGASVGAHCWVGPDAIVGPGTSLAPRVVFGARCSIGARGIVHSGVVVGADGFGFAPHAGRYEKIAQLGAVRIGDDVEIGANSCIDRGALDDTVIEDGVKLDNLVQIAHNVRIGAHTAMAGCAGVAGSTTIGQHCTIGGRASIIGHITLVDHVHVSACTFVSHAITRPGTYSGSFPMDENAAWAKNAATLRQLHTLRDRLRALENSQPGRPHDGAETESAAASKAPHGHP